jgi:hypothetical protein
MLHLLSHVDNECKLLSSTILTCLAMIHFVQGKTGTRQTNILRGSAGSIVRKELGTSYKRNATLRMFWIVESHFHYPLRFSTKTFQNCTHRIAASYRSEQTIFVVHKDTGYNIFNGRASDLVSNFAKPLLNIRWLVTCTPFTVLA